MALAAFSAWPMPPPMSRYHFSRIGVPGVCPAIFHSRRSAALVPLLSPRDTKGARTEAMALFTESQFDLVITDYKMPHMNGAEFNHAGEMSVDDRHLYHEALEAVFPPNIAVSVSEPPKIRRKKRLLMVVGVGVLAGTLYLWLHGSFG